tara:strand:+ start:3153 stop:3434 length:282 start_codon:yes stop_codon:yes gene_type:complete
MPYQTYKAVNHVISYYKKEMKVDIDDSLVVQIVGEHENLMEYHENYPESISKWYNSKNRLMVESFLSDKFPYVDSTTIEVVVEALQKYIKKRG